MTQLPHATLWHRRHSRHRGRAPARSHNDLLPWVWRWALAARKLRTSPGVSSAATRASPARGLPPRWPQACAKQAHSVESAGVVTTPAVAFLARTHGFHAGVVISASHNPWQDNGIKLFGGMASSFPTRWNWPWKTRFFTTPRRCNLRCAPFFRRSRTIRAPERLHPVPDRLRSGPLALGHLNIVADCANGAAAAIAPELASAQSRGARQHHTAQHRARRPQHQRPTAARCIRSGGREVKARGADLGVTFDGDADRCMLAGPHRQRDQRRRHSADGGARPEGARHA
jgi:hypothetical protein